MKIATWNVNSIKARMDNVMGWLRNNQPDVLLLQEIKCETNEFPRLEFESLGYKAEVVGQKSYNGVALLSRFAPEKVLTALSGDPNDGQARYVEATIQGIRIASIYLPNGNPIGTEKFAYKLDWMRRLTSYAKEKLREERPMVLGGDFNVIPTEKDVYDPKGWEQDALYHPDTRAAYRTLIHTGLTDAFRALHPDDASAYTFWSYRARNWELGEGLRIDHFLLSPEAVDRMTECYIDKAPRGEEKASDHVPLIMVLN